MVAMEMDIPTGYVITNDVLRAMAQSEDIPNLRRAEQYDRKVVFYFDYVSCIHAAYYIYKQLILVAHNYTVKIYMYLYISVTCLCDQLTEDPTCVRFRMDRWFPIANMTIQHKLRVYDYYEPGRRDEKKS